MGVVQGLLDDVLRETSRVLVLRGQPGIGKTALLRAMAERAEKGGLRLVETTGVQVEIGSISPGSTRSWGRSLAGFRGCRTGSGPRLRRRTSARTASCRTCPPSTSSSPAPETTRATARAGGAHDAASAPVTRPAPTP
jgi:hypothetical protein